MEKIISQFKSDFDNKKGIREVLPFSFSSLECHLLQEEDFQWWLLALSESKLSLPWAQLYLSSEILNQQLKRIWNS
jgi:hypothetical protein